jgi:hypothetical protein
MTVKGVFIEKKKEKIILPEELSAVGFVTLETRTFAYKRLRVRKASHVDHHSPS